MKKTSKSLLWVLPTLVLFSMGTVWLRLSIVRTTYAIGQVDRQIIEARQENEQLLVKVAALRSPRRLEQLGKSSFGLIQPKPEQTVHLKLKETRNGG